MTDLCKWTPAKFKAFPGGDTECNGKYVAKMTLTSQLRVLTVSRVALDSVHPAFHSSEVFHARPNESI